jgi:hypothetical protein
LALDILIEYGILFVKGENTMAPEDFGWFGDERMIGDCMDDWAMDRLDILADQAEERERAREELALEFDPRDPRGQGNASEGIIYERDALDFVREQEESQDPDYPEPVGQDLSEYDEGGEFGECEWED